MKQYMNYFLNYLQTEKDAAKSTVHKYRADIERLFEYLQVTDINEINQNHLRDYSNHIRETYNYTSSSIAFKKYNLCRIINLIKSPFFHYIVTVF